MTNHRRVMTGVIAFGAIALLSLPGRAAVTVSYGDPDRFTDVADRSNDPRRVMLSLERFLKELGDHYLPPGTNLDIEIIDVDRAGRPRMNLPTEVRIVTGKADPPCIELSYKMDSSNTSPAIPRRERVCDLDYLRMLEAKYSEHDPLVYEKRMLEEWFRARFGR